MVPIHLDAQPCPEKSGYDFFPSEIAQTYLSNLVDEDHKQVIAYFRNAKVTFNHLILAVLHGCAGGGKTTLAAKLIVALLLQDTTANILGVVATNQALDVIGHKILKELDEARKKTEYATRLAGMTVTRTSTHSTESYTIPFVNEVYNKSGKEAEAIQNFIELKQVQSTL